MRVVANPEHAALGAVVTGLDLAKPVSRADARALRRHWLDHLVLVFPDQDLDDDGLERVTGVFGPFGQDPFIAPVPGRQHVLEVRREADETTPVFAAGWHSDWSFLARPPAATLLHARVIPPVGGDTLFQNQIAACAALPPDLRAAVAGRLAIHSAARPYARGGFYDDRAKGRSMDIRPSDEALRTQLHPIVKSHPETGREALFVNPGYTIGIDGMDQGASDTLLARLFRHAVEPRFVYRHVWRPGMLVVWDNRATQHMATGGYDGRRRVLHRTTAADDPRWYLDAPNNGPKR
jgi:taurine dioxygenase